MWIGKMFAAVAGMMWMTGSLLALDVDAVRSGMGEESLVPMVVTPTAGVPSAASPTAGNVDVNPAVAVSGTAAGSEGVGEVFRVSGVVVDLKDTQGFGRDAALERAARESLPKVLVRMGQTPEAATKNVKNLGSAMRFVQGYKVVKESLIPHYSLTADLTFNEAMLMKNFGAVRAPVAAVSATVAADQVAITPAAPLRQWVVTLENASPAQVDRVRGNLNAQASSQAVYRVLTSTRAELLVETPLDAAQLQAAAGEPVRIEAFAEIRPAAVEEVPVVVGPELTPWQGQDDKPVVPGEVVRPLLPWSRF